MRRTPLDGRPRGQRDTLDRVQTHWRGHGPAQGLVLFSAGWPACGARRMTIKRIIGAAAGGVFVAVAGVALAANFTSSKQTDYFSAGQHAFYVWCAGGSDFTTTQPGTSAEDAQM